MAELDYAKLTKQELLALAARKKINASSRLLKKDLIAFIKKELKAKETARTTSGKPRAATTKAAAKPQAAAKTARIKTGETKSVKKSSSTKKTTAKKKSAAASKAVKKSAKKTTAAKAAPAKNKAAAKAPGKARAPKRRTKTPTPPPEQNLRPPFELEDMSQEAKFLIGKPTLRDEWSLEATPELPAAYGEDKLALLARDPHWAHIYWELREATLHRGYEELGEERDFARAILRIHALEEGSPPPLDIDIDFRTRRHNLDLGRPGARFRAEIGLLGPGGRFVPLAQSNTVKMPADGPSDLIDEQWMTSDAEFEHFYRLSAGPGAGALGEKSRSRRSADGEGSFGVGSFSAPRTGESTGVPPSWLRAEVVLYGGTAPGGRVTLGDEPIDVRPDGSFSIRLALPEGRHALPITFHSPGGEVLKRIVPEIIRKNGKSEVSS